MSRKRKVQSSQSSKKIGPNKKNTISEAASKPERKGKGKENAASNGPTVMLISLQCGSQGLNLTAAQVSFLG